MPRRVVAVDLGTRRMGVAVTDALGLSAHPHATLQRQGGRRDLTAIADIVRRFDAERVVMGLPLDPDGNAGRAAVSARAFAERLQAVLPVPVEMCDESFSTVEAEEVLLAANLSRARRRQVVDRIAAAVILRRWMEARGGGRAA